MEPKVIIYGKPGWPYTERARAAYKDHDYVNVKESRKNLDAMLKWSNGSRQVPVIVQGDDATIGYGGSW